MKIGRSFGLRTLLILITITAIVASYYGNRWYRDHLEEVAIEAINDAGAKTKKNKQKKIVRVLFRGEEFGDDQLREMTRHLRHIRTLKELDFVQTSITDKGIDYLKNVRHIEELYLFETKMTPDGVRTLQKQLPKTVLVKTEQPEPISSGMASMNVYSHAMVALDWTPDGAYLATGNGAGKIQLWDFVGNEPVLEWNAHEDWAFALAYSPNGSLIATGGGDDTIRLWDAQSKVAVGELHGHTDDVHKVVFTPDGKTLISSGDDKTIRFWDLESGTETRKLTGHKAQIPSITISPDGTLLASASRDDTVCLWEVKSGALLKTFPTDGDFDVNTVAFDPETTTLASGDQSGTIRLWDLETLKLKQTMKGHNGKIYKIAFDELGQELASCGDDGIRMWFIESGTNIALGQKYVSNLAFHPTDDLLASTSAAGEVHLYDTITGERLKVNRTMFGERGFEFED